MIQTHRYFLGNDENREGWNLVILDQDESECTLFASGDYDSHVGRFYFEKDFREALLDFDKEYLIRKIAKKDVYDGKTTLEEIKRYILSLFKDGSWNREKARKEWDLLNEYEFDYKEQFYDWVEETEINDGWEFEYQKYPIRAVAFAERTLPRLQQLISKELGKEVKSA
jgi:hypothetical protein